MGSRRCARRANYHSHTAALDPAVVAHRACGTTVCVYVLRVSSLVSLSLSCACHHRYRCRLGEGILEKLVSEEEVRTPIPAKGFQYCIGQTVQIERPNGLLELATVLATTMDKSRMRPEPWYECRFAPSEVSPQAHVESVHEEDLRVPRPQAGCGFYVGQLVQVRRPDATLVLARVTEFCMVGYSLGYKCAVEDALTRGATW